MSLSFDGQLVLQGGILLFCAFVQSAVGFAFSLFANSLLLLSGLALPETVMISTLGSNLQRVLMTARMHDHVDWRTTLPMSGICLLTMPVGICVLKLLSLQSIAFAKVGMGILILSILIVQQAWKVHSRPTVPRVWGVLAAATSGVLTGLAHIGGPPLLLWVHAHDWTVEKTRITVAAISLILAPFQIALMLGTFGFSILPSVSQTLLLIPSVVVGALLGLVAGERLSKSRLRLVAFVLLAITCMVSIVGPLHDRVKEGAKVLTHGRATLSPSVGDPVQP